MCVDEKLGPSRSAGREVLAFLEGPCTFFESTFRPRKTGPVRRFCHASLHFRCLFWRMFFKDGHAKSPVGTAKSGVGTGHRRFPLIKSTCGWKKHILRTRAVFARPYLHTFFAHTHNARDYAEELVRHAWRRFAVRRNGSHAAPNASRICYLRLQESEERGKCTERVQKAEAVPEQAV